MGDYPSQRSMIESKYYLKAEFIVSNEPGMKGANKIAVLLPK